MREKLETLSLTKLKEFAKEQGIRGYGSMRKADLIDILCEKSYREKEDSALEAVSSGDKEPFAKAVRSVREKTKPLEQEKPPVKEAKELMREGRPSAPAASANRPNPNDKRRPAVRPYRQEGQQRNNYYRQSQADGSERQERPELRQEKQEPRQERSELRQERPEPRQERPEPRQEKPEPRQERLEPRQEKQEPRQERPEPRQERQEPRQERQEPRQERPDQYQAVNKQEPLQEANEEPRQEFHPSPELQELDSGIDAYGILEVMPDGFGFIRCENYLPGENDVYVAPSQIRRFNMKTGDMIQGSRRVKTAAEKFAALLFIKCINGYPATMAERRLNFESMTPIFPNRRLHMETQGGRNTTAMRVLDLLAPIGKGQRGMIVSPPKAGKTTLLKQVAKAVTVNHPEMHLIILLIDERPEEVTDIRESITGNNVEVLYSTFDELPERHKRVSEMVIERAKRLVEHGRDVVILLDSITRLARAYNLTVAPSGRTLSGGLDPAALHMPKRFFGAARNLREGGSLTILASALVDTGSRMDDVIYEEFKGTGNMELVLDRKLSEKRIFPAIDILKSGTRRDDLILSREEAEAVDIVRKATNTLKPEDAVEKILDLFARTRTNREFVEMSKKLFRY